MVIHFDTALHNEFVAGHGQALTYYRAYFCPCGANPENYDANRVQLTCTVCDGTGIIYNTAQGIVGLITGIRNMKELIESGIAIPGDCVLGLAPGQSIQFKDWDKVVFPWAEPYQGENIIRGQRTGNATDRLAYTPVKIDRAFRVDLPTDTIIDFVQNVDYTIAGRTITWQTGTNIQQGMTYNITYTCNFEWVVFASPMMRFESSMTMGQRCLLKKRHIVFA